MATYKLANTGVAITWHDCVLSDVTKFVKESPKGTWRLSIAIKEQLKRMADDQDGPEPCTSKSTTLPENLVSPTLSTETTHREDVSEADVSLLVVLCLDGITMVSTDSQHTRLGVLSITVSMSSHNVMMSSHNVMMSSHNVMMSSHNVMMSSQNVHDELMVHESFPPHN